MSNELVIEQLYVTNPVTLLGVHVLERVQTLGYHEAVPCEVLLDAIRASSEQWRKEVTRARKAAIAAINDAEARAQQAEVRAERADEREANRSLRARQQVAAAIAETHSSCLIDGIFTVPDFAVYQLFGEDHDQPLYVGESTNVFSRIGTHLTDPRRRAAVRAISITACASLEKMHKLEAALIDKYQPAWNIKGVREPTYALRPAALRPAGTGM